MTGAKHRFRMELPPEPQATEVLIWFGDSGAGHAETTRALGNLAADYDALKAKADAMAGATQYALSYMADGGEPRHDEDGEEICPFFVLREALAAYINDEDSRSPRFRRRHRAVRAGQCD